MKYRVISISDWSNKELPRIAELENLNEQGYGNRFKAYLFKHIGNNVSAIGAKNDLTGVTGFMILLKAEKGIPLEDWTNNTILISSIEQ